MDVIAAWPENDRRDLFSQTAAARGLAPAIVEKDFWVCWTLKHVFGLTMAPHLLFKGGTSLSKIYSAIQRFSEDIDLSIHRDHLGFGGDNDPMLLTSNTQRDKKIEALKAECSACIRDEFMPDLRKSFTRILGLESPSIVLWTLELDPNDSEQQTVLFTYPAVIANRNDNAPPYIQPVVRLEMAALIRIRQAIIRSLPMLPSSTQTCSSNKAVMCMSLRQNERFGRR
ncbi:MAG: nucleotidyl transferase AbiEii/AbiGii toxin family protein [Capsulimonadaceae bacterium]